MTLIYRLQESGHFFLINFWLIFSVSPWQRDQQFLNLFFLHQILQVASISDLNVSDDGESRGPEGNVIGIHVLFTFVHSHYQANSTWSSNSTNSTAADSPILSHWFADVLSVVSEADLECLSEETNGSLLAPLPTDRQDAGYAEETCYSARSTLLRYCRASCKTSLPSFCTHSQINSPSVFVPKRVF